MVKTLGISVNIILAILYVYYCEINAEADKLDFWEPNRDLDARRAQSKKRVAYNKSGKGPRLRAEEHIKFTRGFPMELRYSSPKHFPKNGEPHIEPILRIRDVSNSDSDFDTDDNHIGNKSLKNDSNHNIHKNNQTTENHNTYKKKQHLNKNHASSDGNSNLSNNYKDQNHNNDMDNKKDKYLIKNKDFKKDDDPNIYIKKDKSLKNYTDLKKYKSIKRDKDHKKARDHKKDTDLKKESDHKIDINHDIDKNDKRGNGHIIDYNTNKFNKNKYSDNDNDHDRGYDHKKDKNRNKDQEPSKNNNKKKLKDHKEIQKQNDIDKTTVKDNDKTHNKGNNHVRTSYQGIQENPDNMKNDPNINRGNPFRDQEKHRFKKKDKDIKIGGPMQLPGPKKHEYKQGQILDKTWLENPHPSKLRTHKHRSPMHTIESTRMTPMYLMQQGDPDEPEVGGGGGGGTKGTIADRDDPAVVSYLSPYSLKAQLQDLLDGFRNVSVTIETLGRTVEYNDILMAKIIQHSDATNYFRAEESKYVDEVPEKKIIFIAHGLSVMGMGKIGALSTVHGIRIVLSYYLAHLDKFDIYFMPMANPDGYAASHSKNLWNKNMSPQGACPGVAVDRNFDVAWNGTRQISSCSQLYPGSAPFSEVESKAIREVFHYHGHKILAYIHVHAGTYTSDVFKGDAILYPRGYSESQSDDDKYIDLKGEIDEAMKNASFQVLSVTVDTLYNWYGKVTGTSVDYASTVYGIPYALEFVMQMYEGDDGTGNTNEFYAVTEIWSRLIVTTFNNIWKSLHVNNEVKKK